jgi:hypothetical protein
MTMRKAFALAAVSSLAVVGAAPMVSAQTNNLSTIAVNLVDGSARPTGVTGYNVATNCNNLQGTGAQTVTSSFAASGTNNITFALTSNSSCAVTVTAGGTAAAALGGSVKVTFGDPNTGPSSTGAFTAASGTAGVFAMTDAQRVAVTGNNQITVTITYPSFSVKKVVIGEEPTAGFDYPMAAVCYFNDGVIYGTSRFTLKKDASTTIGLSQIPQLTVGTICHVTELNGNGAANVSIVAQPTGAGAAALQPVSLPAINPFNATFTPPLGQAVTFASAGFNPNGTAVTVTNSFVGDLLVSKVVSGDPKTNIAIYEINVSCNGGGPRETFLLKDRQSKLFTGIPTGARCNVQELRSDGAEATYSDNSGENTTDGIVTIKATASGCIDRNLSSFPDCRANVIVTNTYGAATTTAAPATTAAAAVATTAAPVAPAPVEEPEELAEEEATIG